MLILEYSSVSKFSSSFSFSSLFLVRFSLSFCLVSFWAFYNFSYIIFTSLSPLTTFGCARPFMLTVEGILYMWSSKWDDLYPTNQRWAAGAWVGVVSSFQLSPFVYLRRCRTCRVGLLLNRSMPQQVHNFKYLSRYYSKIFKLYLCESYFTY
jgi:hypothetical protein